MLSLHCHTRSVQLSSLESSNGLTPLLFLTGTRSFGRLRRQRGKGFVKFVAFLIIFGCASVAWAQQVPTGPGTTTNIVTLASSLLEHDFFNVFAYANGVYDSQTYSGSSNLHNFGEEVGGGVTAFHVFHNGQLSLNYSGGYRNYSGSFGSGTNQNLAFGIAKQLSKRWTIRLSQGGGIYLYGGTYFSTQPVGTNTIATNPFSPETRFLNSDLSLTYQQTRRLSFTFTGDFFLYRYNYPGAIGTTALSGAASGGYRITRRTSVGAGYSHSYYHYQRNAGTVLADSVFLTLSHEFANRWNANISAGATRTSGSGTVEFPVVFLNNGQLQSGYVLGHYNQTAIFPSYSGSLSRSLRRSTFSLSGGQGINAGNGYLLASKSEYVSGFYSYSWLGSSLGLGGSYSTFSSVSNTVSNRFDTASFLASYSKVLMRYFGVSAAYSFIYYPSYKGASDNRISAGIFFTSRSIPTTLF